MKRALQFALGLLLGLHGLAAAQTATVMTDRSDYSPGQIVTITGTGWQPGETVTLSFVESPLLDTHPDLYATADANGNILNTQFSPDDHDISVTFTLTATGQISGLQAQTIFTDSKNLTVTFAGNGTGSVAVADITTPGDNTTCTGNPCSVITGNGDVGTLTASANAGSTFTGWSGQSSGVTGCSGNTCNFSMGNAAQSVTATFVLNHLTITSVNGGSSPTAGTGFSVVVQAQNGNGTPMNVSANTGITLTLNTGTGTLSGTLTGTITAGTNSVTINGVIYSKAENGVVLKASRTSGDTLASGNSASFKVNPGAATKLVYTSVPTTGSAGTSFSVTVQSQDANGNPSSPTSATTITLSKASGGGTLSGTLTGSISTSATSVTISGIVYSKADTMTLTASATAGETSLTAVTSGNIVFSAGNLDHFSFATIGTQTAGAPFSITITAMDAFGNTVTSFSGNGDKVVLTSSGTLVGSPITTSSFTNGVLSNQSVTITSTGNTTITATQSGAGGTPPTGISNSFTVNAAAASKLVFTNTPVTVAARVCSSPLTIQSQDSFGNPSNLSGTETLSASASPSTGISFYTDNRCTTLVSGSTLTIAGGSNTTTLYFKDASAGSVAITVTGSGVFTANGPNAATQTETVTRANVRSGQTIVARLFTDKQFASGFEIRSNYEHE